MVPESKQGLTSTIFPEHPPVPWLDLATGTFLIPRRLEGPRFQNKSKEVGRSSTRRAFVTLSTLCFLRTAKCLSVVGSTFCI